MSNRCLIPAINSSDVAEQQTALDLHLVRLCWSVIFVTSLLRLGVAAVRYLQVDELQILHLAWLRASGSVPGIDHAFPQFSLLIDLIEPMWAMLGSDLAGIWITRLGMWIVSLAILAALWQLTKLLIGEVEALATVTVLSLFTDFHERVIEVRSDPLIVLCLLLAFFLLARNRNRGAVAGAGILAAVALALNFKALTALPFLVFAALLPVRANRERPLQQLLFRSMFIVVGLLAGLLLYGSYLQLRGDIPLFVETVSRNLRVATAPESRFSAAGYLFLSIKRNLCFYALALMGLGVLVWRQRRSWTHVHWLPPLLFTAVYVYLNPTFFPYNFIDVAPFWAMPAGVALALVFQRFRTRVGLVVVGVMLIGVSIRLGYLLKPTIGDQLAINRFAMAVTESDERVYDASGLILFRRGPYHWRLHSLMQPRYMKGAFQVRRELYEQPPRLFIPSYRTDWLSEADSAAVERLFVDRHPNVRVLGWVFDSSDLEEQSRQTFPLLLPGYYRLRSEESGEARLLIDGEPARERRWLRAGVHTMSVEDANQLGRVTLLWDRPGLSKELGALPKRELNLFYYFTY